MHVDEAAEEQVPRKVDEGSHSEDEPGRRDRQVVRLDEERAHEDERAGPRRVGEELADRPPRHARVPEHPAQTGPRRRRRASRLPVQGSERQATASASGTTTHTSLQLRSPTTPAIGMPTTHASGGPRSASARTRDLSTGELHSATAAIAAVYERPTPMPTKNCAHAEEREVRRDARSARSRHATSASPAPISLRSPNRAAARPVSERGRTRRETGDRPQLTRDRRRDVEAGRHRCEHRCEDEQGRLGCGEAEEERDARRAGRPHQMMIGTVPPSALHAAPVTYDARSEQRKTITAAISSGRARRPERPSGADLREHVVAFALLVGEPTVAQPGVRGSRPGRDRVAADAVLRVQVGDEPREREHGSLGHGVVRHARRRSLPGGRRDVHDRTTALAEVRKRRTNRAHVAHDVELPVRVPLRRPATSSNRACRATPTLFTTHVEPAERGHCLRDDSLRLSGEREVGRDVRDLADARRLPSTAGDDASPFARRAGARPRARSRSSSR